MGSKIPLQIIFEFDFPTWGPYLIFLGTESAGVQEQG